MTDCAGYLNSPTDCCLTAQAVQAAADELRERACGDTVTYVVNRNINYTNVCTFKCQFCAFSKGKVRPTSALR